MNDFDYAYLEHLKSTNSAVRLISAVNAPLILGFLHQVFIQGNRDSIFDADIMSKLSDYLYTIQSAYDDARYPGTPKQYLDAWTADGYLRKYFSGLDDQLYEPTPVVSKVFEWIQSLTQRQFVGTESRLLTIFSILQNIVTQTLQDPIEQVNELEKQKAEIQAQIDRIKRGEQEPYDTTRIKEQFYQVEDAVRQLIGDFRQIEKNFRDLNTATRQKIATSDMSKGKLLDSIFSQQDFIRDNDQWKSFAAFWELMLSPERQENLDDMLRKVYALDEIKELEPKPYLLRTRHLLIDAGGRVYKSSRKIAEQLRRYLDNKKHLENRRIMELLLPIEQKALELCDDEAARKASFMSIPLLGIESNLIMTRQLFAIPTVPVINSNNIIAGLDSETDTKMLFMQQFIDRDQLKGNIHEALTKQRQITLNQLIKCYPLEYGAAELIVYLDIAHAGSNNTIDTDTPEEITILRPDGSTHIVTMCRVIFAR
jgi:hypothetical protein